MLAVVAVNLGNPLMVDHFSESGSTQTKSLSTSQQLPSPEVCSQQMIRFFLMIPRSWLQFLQKYFKNNSTWVYYFAMGSTWVSTETTSASKIASFLSVNHGKPLNWNPHSTHGSPHLLGGLPLATTGPSAQGPPVRAPQRGALPNFARARNQAMWL